MASSMRRQPCSNCEKSQGQVTCGGCERWFCIKHLLEHRQDLSRQMDDLTLEHDQLQQNLITDGNDREHPFMSRVNLWESKTIEKVKQIAGEVRCQLRDLLSQSKRDVEKSMRKITEELQENRQTEDYTETDLNRWMDQLKKLKEQLEKPPMIEIMREDEISSTHIPFIQLRIIERMKVDKTRWSMNGQTVAGGHGRGDALNQFRLPFDLEIGDDGTLFISDIYNHRIIRWKQNATQGEIVAGCKGPGNRMDQLNEPLAILIDQTNQNLIISDVGNRRVVRWSLDKHKRNNAEGKVILSNIHSVGLTMDNEGVLYVSDWERHDVRRYGQEDGREGVIVAGGNGRGNALNQLNGPRQIFVDADHSLYVSELNNHRVMKFMRNSKEGFVVAGGQGNGNRLEQLSSPSGIFVDRMGSVYVADQGNHRLMRWMKGAQQGEVIAGDHGRGSQSNQFNGPTSILFDNQENLYVVDANNNRIQRFDRR